MTYTGPLLADVEKNMQVANGQMQKGCGGRRGSAWTTHRDFKTKVP